MGVVNTVEPAKILTCSGQNIDDLIKRGKPKPIKETANEKLFLSSFYSRALLGTLFFITERKGADAFMGFYLISS